MIVSARVAAAIDVLAEIESGRRPAADALKDWGRARRFAGSKDRAAIASLVYDALRQQAAARWLAQDDSARGTMIGMLQIARGANAESLERLFTGEGHAPPPLSGAERAGIGARDLADAPDEIAANVPAWLAPALREAFGEAFRAEGAAFARRAPVDLRVNGLKAKRDEVLADLAHLQAIPTPYSPMGLRAPVSEDGRAPDLKAEPVYARGRVEVQDEGSQLAALLSGAAPGRRVLDFCAGGGGKSLAMAAMMENRGQIFATDRDGRRLMPIYDRLARAGARNVQVRAPRRGEPILEDLAGKCDIALVDAPCSGTGTWRRNPDAKWRMRPGALEQRCLEQATILDAAARYVRPGGRLIYVTCSVLIAENEAQISAFLRRAPEFTAAPAERLAEDARLPELKRFSSVHGLGLRLSPASSGTDGFFIAGLERKAG